nr:hemolysin family protein [Deinobacterium chartae]
MLVVLNGIFVAAEFAIVAVRAPKALEASEQGSAVARYVYRLITSPTGKDRYIAVAQLGITLASIGLGMYGEKTVASWLYGPLEEYGHLGHAAAHTVGTIISLGLITYMHVVFGEMIPKALALQFPERTAYSVTRMMQSFGGLFAPLVTVLNAAAFGLMRLLRIHDPGSGNRLYSSEELELLVRESAQSGLVEPEQQQLIERIFHFGEREAHHVMTPRTRLVALESSTPGEVVLEFLREHGHSRYPVYQGDLDHILGFVHVKDVIRAQTQRPGPLVLSDLLHIAPSVPRSMGLEDVLAVLKRERVHAAIVTDEFGGTAGMVTLQDLLEEIVGEEEVGESLFEELGDGRLRVRGDAPVELLEQALGQRFEEHNADTVAGLLLEELGRNAQSGDSVELPGVRLTAEAVEGPLPRTVLVERAQLV